MKIVQFYSHLNGHEWLLVHHRHIWKEFEQVIATVDAEKCKTKVSEKKTMTGKLLYSPSELNVQFAQGFQKSGWKESRTSYWVTDEYNLIRKTLRMEPAKQKREIEAADDRATLSQTDFLKARVAIEVQLGKYSFVAHDLFVKHLAFYVGDEIDLGIEVLPMKSMQEQMSSGPGYYEGALYDVARQGRGVPGVPLILVGIAP
ncbi:MAG: BglII/BstYI family type II restriction endonuclease [Terriglobia bacterium]